MAAVFPLPRRAVAALALLAAAACDAGGGPEPVILVRDSAGVTILESVAPVGGDTLLAFDPEPLLRIGAESGGPEQLGAVYHAVFLDGGRIALAELTSNQIRVFDDAGQHLRNLGGAGTGPGEFRLITALHRYRGDSILAYDQQAARTTVFPLGGGNPRTIANGMEGNYQAFGVLGDGRVLFYDPGRGYRPDLPAGLQWVASDVVAMTPSGRAAAVATLPQRQQVVLEDGNTASLAPAHYAAQAAAEDGFYWGTSDRWEIGQYDGSGRLVRILRRPVEPVAVEPAMIEAWIEEQLAWVRRSQGEAGVPATRRRLEEGRFGETVPLFAQAFVDRDGRLWIGHANWPESSASPRRWSVFSAEGPWLGDVAVPDRMRLVDAARDRVLAIWQDDLDVPHVQVHAVPGIALR